MLDDFLIKLKEELQINFTEKEKFNSYIIEITPEKNIEFFKLDETLYFRAPIIKCPDENKEDVFIHVMKANLLGQGTGNSIIGIDEEDKFLTLSMPLPYELDYIEFKEHLEDFVNFLFFWKEEIEKIEKQAKQKIL